LKLLKVRMHNKINNPLILNKE